MSARLIFQHLAALAPEEILHKFLEANPQLKFKVGVVDAHYDAALRSLVSESGVRVANPNKIVSVDFGNGALQGTITSSASMEIIRGTEGNAAPGAIDMQKPPAPDLQAASPSGVQGNNPAPGTAHPPVPEPGKESPKK